MKKRLLSWMLLIALLLSQLSVVAFASDGGDAAKESRNGVVRILALNPDGSYSTGSAFGVGEVGEETNIFVTNHHVVNATITQEDGSYAILPAVHVWIMKNSNAFSPVTGVDTSQCIPCEVIYSEEDGYPDMAILRASVKPEGRVALPLLDDESDLEEGDDVYALGYPSSSDYTEQGVYGEALLTGIADVTITRGVVSRFTTSTTFGNTRIIQHNSQINHGNSGGPLLNEDGIVVGINTYGFGGDASTGDSSTYASVRIGHVKEVLDDLEIEYDTDGISAWVIIVIVVGGILIAAAVVLVILLNKRKNPSAPVQQPPVTASAPVAEQIPSPQPGPYADNEPRLQCIRGVFAGQRFSINGSVRMGRDPSRNDLLFPSDVQGISGVHCVIVTDGDQVYLTDLGSTYGTFLGNGQRLAASETVRLNIGDQFWLGSENEMFVISPRGGI